MNWWVCNEITCYLSSKQSYKRSRNHSTVIDVTNVNDVENFTTSSVHYSNSDDVTPDNDSNCCPLKTNCTSCFLATSTDVFSIRNHELVRVEVALQSAIFVFAITGNVLVLLALCRHAAARRRPHQNLRQHHQQHPAPVAAVSAAAHSVSGYHLSRMDFMIFHLAVADLSVAFFNVLPQLIWDATQHFQGNDFLCRTVAYLQVG